MAQSSTRRKIARSSVRRVKRNATNASKNVKRKLKHRLTKRKVMNGGENNVRNFNIYLVYYSPQQGLLRKCPEAKLPINLMGLLFYNNSNNDFYFFGYHHFNNQGHDEYLADNHVSSVNPRVENIFEVTAEFIRKLCGIEIGSTEDTKLNEQSAKTDRLYNTDITGGVTYCYKLNRTRFTKKLTLSYLSGHFNDYVYDGVRYRSSQIINRDICDIPKENKLIKPSELLDDNYVLDNITVKFQDYDLERNPSEEVAIVQAKNLFSDQKFEDYAFYYKDKLEKLKECLSQQQPTPVTQQTTEEPNP